MAGYGDGFSGILGAFDREKAAAERAAALLREKAALERIAALEELVETMRVNLNKTTLQLQKITRTVNRLDSGH